MFFFMGQYYEVKLGFVILKKTNIIERPLNKSKRFNLHLSGFPDIQQEVVQNEELPSPIPAI